jgi:hypothetical protein
VVAFAAGMVGFLVGGLAGVALVEVGWAVAGQVRRWVLPPGRAVPSDRWGMAEFLSLILVRPAAGLACGWLGCGLAMRAAGW